VLTDWRIGWYREVVVCDLECSGCRRCSPDKLKSLMDVGGRA